MDPTDREIASVRSFNRFYTKTIGVLRKGVFSSPFSLAEARVLYELAHRRRPAAFEIGRALGLDPGYLSRILRRLERQGQVVRAKSGADGRRRTLALTERGRRSFSGLDRRTNAEVAALLRPLSPGGRRSLIDSMGSIAGLLGGSEPGPGAVSLRPPVPGDLGWIVHRHGTLYFEEYGWDERFEALVARIVADFVEHLDAKRERCWVAERGGEILGSIFLVRKSATVAKLRLLYVEPSARGLGVGSRLVGECVEFARRAGYRRIVLWTQKNLAAARHLYRKAGFRLTAQKPHRSFGQRLVAETWELDLVSRPRRSE